MIRSVPLEKANCGQLSAMKYQKMESELFVLKDGGGTIDAEEITEIVLGCFRMAGGPASYATEWKDEEIKDNGE